VNTPLPPGTCSVFTTGGAESITSLLLKTYGAQQIDAGPSLAINDGNFQLEIGGVVGTVGLYRTRIDSRIDTSRPLHVTGSVPPFALPVRMPEPFVWKNREQIRTIRRSEGLIVKWAKSDPSAWIGIAAISRQGIQTVVTYCSPRQNANTFVMPKDSLAHLPGPTVDLYVAQGHTGKPRVFGDSLTATPVGLSVQSKTLEIK
jgi:hypothetical protein